MKRIFKYELEVTDTQTVTMPMNAIVLSVVNQNESMMMYALVDDDVVETEGIEFIVHGTFHPSDDVIDTRFVSTVLFRNGSLVFHVFTNG